MGMSVVHTICSVCTLGVTAYVLYQYVSTYTYISKILYITAKMYMYAVCITDIVYYR